VTRSVSALLTLFVAPTPEWVHWEYPVPRRIGRTRRRSSKEAVLFPADYSLMIKPCCPISHFLVALRPVRDLLLCAKHLFAAAKWQLPAAERSRTRNGTSSGLNYEQDFAAIPMTQKGVVPPGCPRLKCAGMPMAPLLRCTRVAPELIAEPGANEAGRPYFSLPLRGAVTSP
jgi:hypothetical protein